MASFTPHCQAILLPSFPPGEQRKKRRESPEGPASLQSERESVHFILKKVKVFFFPAATDLGLETNSRGALSSAASRKCLQLAGSLQRPVYLFPGSFHLNFKEGFRERVIMRVLQSLLNHNTQNRNGPSLLLTMICPPGFLTPKP